MFERKIAIISDIHGNLTALTAVMDVIDRLEVHEVYCLGDLLGKGAFPREVTEICRRRCAAVMMGNHEDFFLKDRAVDYYNWARAVLSGAQLDWIAGLPLYTDIYLSGRKIRLCHADPRDVHRRVYSRADRELKLSLFRPLGPEDTPPDVFCYGDVHYAYTEYFSPDKTLINAGSVGNPLDLPQACFLLFRGEESEERVARKGAAPKGTVPKRTAPKGPFGFEFIRVPYDIEKEIAMTLASEIPERGRDIYINELRAGTYGKRWSEYS